MDYAGFVAKRKSMIVAPAGYGKTHAIAECLKYTEGKQLILTHTHAGVASLKEKIQKEGIASKQFHVETIESFAQKYCNAFYCGNDVPSQDDSQHYFPFIREKANTLIKLTPIKDVIKATYSGLFVDEYQDCTSEQHHFISTVADILPTHIFGDPLQGIFDFKGQLLVDFDKDLENYEKFPELTEPWRWKNTNPDLGKILHEIRIKLEKKENINLELYKANLEIVYTEETDKYTPKTGYNKIIWDLKNKNNVLIIHPDSSNLNARKDFVSHFSNLFFLVEAIDSKDFYEYSRKFDEASKDNLYQVLYEIMPHIFNGTASRDKWFNKNGVKRKENEEDKKAILAIKECLEKIKHKFSLSDISKFLKKIKTLSGIKCYRTELLSDLCKALEQSEYKCTSVYDAMVEIRNTKRRMGRKMFGKCIGTTLLTKGLEFDTVAILDAHKFKCHKNFYVAITRTRKRLIIFTNTKDLMPYSSDSIVAQRDNIE